ncbi:hypothetical protein [Almyronema epifaneia]|uniref:Low temperature-induced protein n=1 Tax=Almyronema epifaneia S1 TaxID=2991925 RepID=A0ABW6IK30_9CYAN
MCFFSQGLHTRLRQIAAIGLLQLMVWLGSAIAYPAIAVDLQPATNPTTHPFSPESVETKDLDQAAEAVDRASEGVYQGLETTKQIKGKTELRNQKIEEGRDTASKKLKDLADKARSVDDADELTVPEQRVLRQYQKTN